MVVAKPKKKNEKARVPPHQDEAEKDGRRGAGEEEALAPPGPCTRVRVDTLRHED